jgi:hypothetical protein
MERYVFFDPTHIPPGLPVIGIPTASGFVWVEITTAEYEAIVSDPDLARQLGAHQIVGDYAARALSSSCKSGYHRRKVKANLLLSVLTRACNSKCAPRLVHCIDCFLTNRLLST